ncbi:MAG: LytTR family transcriptional regulator [Bacteroidales bacterium]|nr:LytTR family transcriptional regulator [Bacteroidales bacterium]
MKLNKSFYTLKNNLFFCIAAPVFLILFVVIYNPTFIFDSDWISGWGPKASFCLPIVAAIELVALLVSRGLICFLPSFHSLNRAEYLVWLIAEFVVSCLFVSLFLALYFHISYFSVVPKVLLVGLCLNIIPYTLYLLILTLHVCNHRIAQANMHIASLSKAADRSEPAMVRFNDDKGNLKLVVNASRVLYIESGGNYVTIVYDDNSSVVRNTIRNSLKAIEDICSASGLVRCHRSYFVNLSRIKVISRGSEGVFAEMDSDRVPRIPVSKTYAPGLLQLFSEA